MNPVLHKLNKSLAGCVKDSGSFWCLGVASILANCSGWRLCVGQNNLCSATGVLVNAFCCKIFTCDFVR